MARKITRFVNNRREIYDLEEWDDLNHSKPVTWFRMWGEFIEVLMVELGFFKTEKSCSMVRNITLQNWNLDIYFRHSIIGEYNFFLKRGEYQDGGEIWVMLNGNYAKIDVIETSSISKLMCRTSVGNQILEIVRENWEISLVTLDISIRIDYERVTMNIRKRNGIIDWTFETQELLNSNSVLKGVKKEIISDCLKNRGFQPLFSFGVVSSYVLEERIHLHLEEEKVKIWIARESDGRLVFWEDLLYTHNDHELHVSSLWQEIREAWSARNFVD